MMSELDLELDVPGWNAYIKGSLTFFKNITSHRKKNRKPRFRSNNWTYPLRVEATFRSSSLAAIVRIPPKTEVLRKKSHNQLPLKTILRWKTIKRKQGEAVMVGSLLQSTSRNKTFSSVDLTSFHFCRLHGENLSSHPQQSRKRGMDLLAERFL